MRRPSILNTRGRWLVALVACVLAACQGQETAQLRIGLSIWPPNEMAYLASEQEYFGEYGIELIEGGGPAAYLPGYLAGGLDVAVVSLGTALELADLDPGHRIVMVLDYSRGGDALVARKEVASSPTGLRGKRVGYEPSALGAYLLQRQLELLGLTPADVTLVHVDNASFEHTFRTGMVDAIVAWEPTVSRLANDGALVMADSSSFPEEIVDVLVARKQVLNSKRAHLVAFADGWFEALALHERDPARAGALSEQRGHVSQQNYLASFEGVAMLDRDDNLRLMSEQDGGLVQALERQRVFLSREGWLRTAIDVRELVDTSIVAAPP
ncbi:MAG: ABC transporter substrate-binding protein [Pseudomonadota bacterium]